MWNRAEGVALAVQLASEWLCCGDANNTTFAGYCFSVWRDAKSSPIVCPFFVFSSRATMSDPVPSSRWTCDGCRCSFRKQKNKNCASAQLFRATHLVSRSAPYWVHYLTVNGWNDCNYYITLVLNSFSLFYFWKKKILSKFSGFSACDFFSSISLLYFPFLCAFKSALVILFKLMSHQNTKVPALESHLNHKFWIIYLGLAHNCFRKYYRFTLAVFLIFKKKF